MRMEVLFLMLALCYKGNVFTDTENEIQRGEVTGPRSQSQKLKRWIGTTYWTRNM